ncbi:DUF4115 domain-containing protein [Lysobacter sp. GX 14042]|uniref:helix-turn-helix domain-containing protein n=1 Tax=Lysobacter sp. GX 14042 TaxID=2907155 RepID=UPI001F320767|nr:RodZ domain-containing protein [Lysobacter sp. GX 14042]MCE7031382.1 DUF4115 domain-containing protein [Lysobacter sp. GX 14042]
MNQPIGEDIGAVGESCGARLRAARERAGLSLEDLSDRLHMPVASLRALESDDWARAGAPIFVRGQLRSYARTLAIELDPAQVERQLEGLAPPPLVSHSHVPRYRRMFEQATRRAMYIAITAVLAVPVWWTTRPHLSNEIDVRSLDVVPGARVDAPLDGQEPGVVERTPVLASMGGARAPAAAPDKAPPPPPATAADGLVLAFTGASWVEVSAPDGSVIEQALLGEGDIRSYRPGEIGEVVLGNVAAVDARNGGQAVDLSAFARANVARFALSSDGSLQARAD